MVMNAAGIVELTGLTYRKLNYMQEQIDVLKREKTQGKAREYSFRDLLYLKIASLIRSDGIGLSEINQAIKALDHVWDNAEVPGRWAILLRDTRNSKHSSWVVAQNALYMDHEKNERVTHIPGFMYDVAFYASELEEMAVNNEP